MRENSYQSKSKVQVSRRGLFIFNSSGRFYYSGSSLSTLSFLFLQSEYIQPPLKTFSGSWLLFWLILYVMSLAVQRACHQTTWATSPSFSFLSSGALICSNSSCVLRKYCQNYFQSVMRVFVKKEGTSLNPFFWISKCQSNPREMCEPMPFWLVLRHTDIHYAHFWA